jgi:uncharacterized repeat protein (TIGR01451 family)
MIDDGLIVILLCFAFLFSTVRNFAGASVSLPGEFNTWDAGAFFISDNMPPDFVKHTFQRSGTSEYYFKIIRDGSWADGDGWSAEYWINSWNTSWNIPRNDQGNNNDAFMTAFPDDNGWVSVVSGDSLSATSERFGFMWTSAEPIIISGVTRDDVYAGSNVNINITLSDSKCAEEYIYVRYTTNDWTSSDFATASGSGTSYTASIPGMLAGVQVHYYAMTSARANDSELHDYPDLLTLSFKSAGESNFSYIVTNRPPPPPVLIFPEDGDLNFFARRPRFRWDVADEGDPVTDHRVILSKNSDLSDPVFDIYTDSSEFNYQTGVYLDLYDTYYWSVQALVGEEGGDIDGTFSSTNSFAIDPIFITVDSSIAEWGAATFPEGDKSDRIHNYQWQWKDPQGDQRTDIEPNIHADITEFRVTADKNALFFMFKVPEFGETPMSYISIAIDTNEGATGNTFNYQAECEVNFEARWNLELIANIDATGFYDTSWNWTDAGENWFTPNTNPGYGEIGIAWNDMGFSSLPSKLRFTVSVGLKEAGQGNFGIETNGIGLPPYFLDCITTNTGSAWDELSDGINHTYFDINFDTNGQVLPSYFDVETPPVVYAGVPFEINVQAMSFFGGKALDYDRAFNMQTLSNGNFLILSNSGWVDGSNTYFVIANAVGENRITVADDYFSDISGLSEAFEVMRPSIHINELSYKELEWIEIFNNSEYDVHLTNWVITDNSTLSPIYHIEQDLVFPPETFLVFYNSYYDNYPSYGDGINDTDFSDGRGIIYGNWGENRLADDTNVVSLFSSGDNYTVHTIIDFMAYGDDPRTMADTDVLDLAIDAGLWSESEYAATSRYIASSLPARPYGSSLALMPDGNDNNLGSDWATDRTPTLGYSNILIVMENITVSTQSDDGYRGSIMLGFSFRLPDPENNHNSTSGDTLERLVIDIDGDIQLSDIAEAKLWNGNGSPVFNYGFENSDYPENLLMGAGVFDSGSFIFETLVNNNIPYDEAEGVYGSGFMDVHFSLKIASDAVIGRNFSASIPAGGIEIGSTTHNLLTDKSISNVNFQTVKAGKPVVTEYSTGKGHGADDYIYQFVEVFNNSDTDIDSGNLGWNLSVRRGNYEHFYYQGNTFKAGGYMLIAPGSTSLSDFLNYYDINPEATIMTNDGAYLGDFGLALTDPPFILREGNTILAIVDYTNLHAAKPDYHTVERIDIYGSDGLPLDADENWRYSAITGGTTGYYNGFRASQMALTDVEEYTLEMFSSNNLVLDFYIPNNFGSEETLLLLTLTNLGDAVDTDMELFLFREEGTTDGFDLSEDTYIGGFGYLGDYRWKIDGVITIPAIGGVTNWRFYVTATIPQTSQDGRSVRLAVENLAPAFIGPYSPDYTHGAQVAGFYHGPVDYMVSNVSTLYCGHPGFTLTKTVDSVELPDGSGFVKPGGTIKYELKYSSIGNANAYNVVLYDKIPDNTTYYTNELGTAEGWEVQFSSLESPDQTYDSVDYLSDPTGARWIRWRKEVVGKDETDKTLFFSVTVN